MNALWSLLSFLLALGILVSFHELGHYAAAKFCGVKVLKFSVGFGKSIWSYQRSKDSTEWALGSLPLGGYVKMHDQSFREKKLWQRSLVVASGPLANFLLAIVFFSALYMSGVPQLPAKMLEPVKESAAYQAGIYAGDTVTGWKGQEDESFKPIISWNQLRWRLMDAVTAKESFTLEVLDSQNKKQVIDFKREYFKELTPQTDPLSLVGLKPDVTEPIAWFKLQLNPVQAVQTASERVWDISVVSVRMLGGIFTGESSVKQLGGPLSIADMAGKSAQVGWQSYLGFLALISISLGILNLLPFPMLDGGQLLYDVWELLTGKRIPDSWQIVLQQIGVASLMLLTVLALFNDISRLFLR